MLHPYEENKGTQIWKVISEGIENFVETNELEEVTQREGIVGYLCKLINESKEI